MQGVNLAQLGVPERPLYLLRHRCRRSMTKEVFYGLVVVLLAAGLWEMTTGVEENGCSNTHMFEHEEYRQVLLPHHVSMSYPAYRLYLYGEGLYAKETRALNLTGAPVLFLPGSGGSYQQARSLGSVALSKAKNMEGGVHLNVFTVDFNKELVALYGGSMRRQTHFLHECIKAILRLYKDAESPPRSVVLVGHSMGGVLARALFTVPGFSFHLVSLIVTQGSPHLAPVLALDTFQLDLYSQVRRRWAGHADDLRNVTVLSVGGGYRDYHVRSGLTSLPCGLGDPNKLALLATAVPRVWVSTTHCSINWCLELVLATVRAFFDLIEPGTRQFSVDPERRRSVLTHHFIRHPGMMLGEPPESSFSFSVTPEAWSQVNTTRLAYRTPKDGRVKYFLFALSSRRKGYSHLYCRSGNLEMTSWVYGCTRSIGSVCEHAVDLSLGTELLPTYKVVTLSLGDLSSSVSHLVVNASNANGKHFTVECEWQRRESRTMSLPVPHVMSFGLTVADVVINSSGLLHTVQLQHFHQVYQAFCITVASHCAVQRDGTSDTYRLMVPWFREDYLTTVGVPSVTEISGILHTSRPDNTSSVLLQMHTAPNCHYKVSVRTSFPRVLVQVLRFCWHTLPVYVAVMLLLACGKQLSSILRTSRVLDMSEAVAGGLQPHRVHLPVYVLHLLLGCSWFLEAWSILGLPSIDDLPPASADGSFREGAAPAEWWSHLLSPLFYVLGAGMAFWGSALLRLLVRLMSLTLAPLHRPPASRCRGAPRLHAQLLLVLSLAALGGTSCGALSISLGFLLHLYRVLRLQMKESYLSRMPNLALQKHENAENGSVDGLAICSAPSLSERALQQTRDDLQLHLCLSALFALPVALGAPSLVHWARNLRYSTRLDPDPCWPHTVPLLAACVLLTNSDTLKLGASKLLPLTARLPLPLAVAMVIFSPLHLYRITYFLSAALVPLAISCLL